MAGCCEGWEQADGFPPSAADRPPSLGVGGGGRTRHLGGLGGGGHGENVLNVFTWIAIGYYYYIVDPTYRMGGQDMSLW